MTHSEESNERKNKRTELPPAPPAVDPVVYRGVLGELVSAADPTTEADPVGVLVSLMANVSALIGAGPHVQISNARHPLIVWPLLFGRTGAGRKGDATDTADRLTLAAVPEAAHLFVSGLSSGEGLIERIRDPRDENDPGGTEDKRLRILEAEFGSVMARAKREGNTIGAVAREGWSGRPLAVMNRLALRASSSHIAIIGHITPQEFRLRMAATEMAGGTFNRFLPVYVERSKRIPRPEGIAPELLSELGARLREAIERASRHRKVGLDDDTDASRLWDDELYEELGCADDEDGAWTEFARRALPYCRRIAALYAVLDDRSHVDVGDLQAAAGLVRYSIGTAKYVLDRTLCNPRVDTLRRALDGAGQTGLSRAEVSGLFGRNLAKQVLDELLHEVMATGEYVEFRHSGVRGRPSIRYRRATP
ncbi:hypothetical protein ALI22I_28420 [Saccharothrix sp. ALI-22-I]|uniref:DUF3987 domain-containing protein n=1 Tax=Saccharothrix sp. ALI-22-I TaxID=1933778 RepID=UPI0009C97DE2|nr:DUF3987 domain-containing protein [Saccharothrix sp. ALI-22-I]ONI85691.1 hypothetical protein ALI22I_28420 [Saccharothrix sp. ALI-22-I]